MMLRKPATGRRGKDGFELDRPGPHGHPDVCDQDGLESIKTLHREFPASRAIAITVGRDMIGILNFLDGAKGPGARRTLRKPFEVKVLVDAVAAEGKA